MVRTALALALWLVGSVDDFAAEATCSTATGAPPIPTVAPVTLRPLCVQGETLTFDQDGVTRYACLNLPPGAQGPQVHRRWPLLVYLHGSLTTPDSLYTLGRDFLRQHPLPHGS